MIENYTPLRPSKNLEAYQALIEIDKKERSIKKSARYFRAYLLSIALPPIGVYYLFRYLFLADGTSDDMKAGIISLILTVISLLFCIWLLNVSFGQINTISPQSSELLKELITPVNQKTLKELFR